MKAYIYPDYVQRYINFFLKGRDRICPVVDMNVFPKIGGKVVDMRCNICAGQDPDYFTEAGGLWLPECCFRPATDEEIKAAELGADTPIPVIPDAPIPIRTQLLTLYRVSGFYPLLATAGMCSKDYYVVASSSTEAEEAVKEWTAKKDCPEYRRPKYFNTETVAKESKEPEQPCNLIISGNLH